MPLIFGLILLALGASLVALWWSSAFAAALQVLLVFFLLLAGLVLSVVGYSELKAAREFAAKDEEPDTTPDNAAGSKF
jgi:multisubunit Na+/H+ antiporter MnhG subunit